jgi:hypothetical protein
MGTETYRIDRLLAGGGCGDVYVATHLRLGSQVAVKLLLPSLAGNAQALARLQREADVMSTLRHPHIVQILDFDVTEQGVPFLVMELLEGWPLTGRTISGPSFEPRAAVHIVGQIGSRVLVGAPVAAKSAAAVAMSVLWLSGAGATRRRANRSGPRAAPSGRGPTRSPCARARSDRATRRSGGAASRSGRGSRRTRDAPRHVLRGRAAVRRARRE